MTNKKVKIGEVGVDSGQLMVCDPCYINSEWKKTDYTTKTTDEDLKKLKGEFSYAGACEATLGKEKAGQLNFKMGHAGAGVALSSGYGDGCYPVYATYNEDGRIVRITVECA